MNKPTSLHNLPAPKQELPIAPLQADYQAILEAPVDSVFAAVSNSKQLCVFVPELEEASIVQSDSGLLRRCNFGNDMIVVERIVLWQPPSSYAYAAIAPNPFGLRHHYATVNCKSFGDGTHFRWQHYFDHDDLVAMISVLDNMSEQTIGGLIDLFGGQRLQSRNSEQKNVIDKLPSA